MTTNLLWIHHSNVDLEHPVGSQSLEHVVPLLQLMNHAVDEPAGLRAELLPQHAHGAAGLRGGARVVQHGADDPAGGGVDSHPGHAPVVLAERLSGPAAIVVRQAALKVPAQMKPATIYWSCSLKRLFKFMLVPSMSE